MRVWSHAVLNLLYDRGPMTTNDLASSLWPMVPPGQAWRKQETVRSAGGKGGPKERSRPKPHDELIRLGARSVVKASINSMLKSQTRIRPLPDGRLTLTEYGRAEIERARGLKKSRADLDITMVKTAQRLRRLADTLDEGADTGLEYGQVRDAAAQLRAVAEELDPHKTPAVRVAV